MTTHSSDYGLSPEERELFELMLREEGIEAGESTVPRRPEGAELVLSFAQERLWFLEQMEPGASTYHMPAALSLKGRLDVPALRCSLDEILARHEVLRTSFTTVGGRLVQEVAPRAETPFQRIDLARLGAGARKRETRRLAAEHAARPFDLTRGPLVRAALVGAGAEEHVLLWAVHHIASDGWSTAILVRELESLYAAFSRGRPSPLAELPVQYADFALWQRGHLVGEVLAEHVGYWRERLDGLEGGTELPLDAPRPAVRRFRGGASARELPQALSEKLRAWSGERDLTLFMTLLAAFKVLLGRLSGDAEVTVGTPIAGRELPETEELIGIFLNNLVLRTSLEGDPTFEELAERLREVTVGAYAHQDLPFEKLLTELKPERDPSRTPLFQVYFNMLNLPPTELVLEGLTMEVLDPGEAASKFDFTLYVDDGGPRIAVRAVYNALLFSSRRVDEMLRQYERVLEQAARSPRGHISGIDLLTDEARAALPDPREELDGTWRGAVHELVAAAARQDPRKVAVADRDGAWTYGELVEMSHRLAHRLIEGGVERGDPVAVYAHRSAALAWAVLGVGAAGAAFVLIDPAYPARHVVEILRRARVKAFLALEAAGPLPSILTAYLDEQPGLMRLALPPWREVESRAFLADLPSSSPGVDVGPDDVAAISFTSGSTGVPKGIVGRHGPLTHFLPWQSERFGLTADDRYSLLSGLAHDPLQRDLFTSLCLGATLVVPDPERLLAAGYLASWMAEEEITVAHLTPAMAQVVTEVPEPRPEPLAALRWVFLTGDALTRRDVERLRRLAPAARAVNFYGSTETQRAVAFYEAVPGRNRAPGQVLPLGRGMRDVQLLVTNDAGRLAGIGELGEVRVRSPHLARGYLDEEATAERFRPNPFREPDPADRVYLTGDLGRYLPDGNVAFAGRRDTQVKVRGYRIELPEIEAALDRHPAVGEAVVEARASASGTELVAWVVPAEGAEADPDALQGHLRERLPQYMVPAAFGVLEALPLTPNGKVDRRALARRPLPSQERGGEGLLPAEGDLEETLARIWREVLGVEEVGVRDNFFDLGGHSLLLVRLHSRLMEELGADLSLTELFNYPNIRSQAELLSRRRAAPAAGERRSPPAAPAARTPGGGAVAVVAMAGRFPGAADVDELWSNLRAGVEAISFFSDDELEGTVDPALLAHPKFVKARGVLDGVDLFDADFFGYSPREAELLDPQHRLFLECAWEALERAGYDPGRVPGPVGVFGGMTLSSYLLHHILPNRELVAAVGGYQSGLATDKDFLTTRVSYKLGLEGPSLDIQTACSTSLVATVVACQSLLAGQCDMALAGGVSVRTPQKDGYLYKEGGLDSSDGHCRAFDARADGSVYGSGVGVVVLKRLEDALAQGDQVEAVILGAAFNNDGAHKVGFTAPSIEGQARVVAAALAAAGVPSASVGYVEAHGTGTALGDPIEIAALTRAFTEAGGNGPPPPASCAVGSVKTNVGHLSAAAGVTGLIKAALTLKHGEIPPSLNFSSPNPQIDFAETPFYVATRATPWPGGERPRRAGVSSFGLGGTNAHLVLEEAPKDEPSGPSRPWQPIVLSARTEAALEAMTDRLTAALESSDEGAGAADVAYTLALGRRAFSHRRMVVARSAGDARLALASRDPRRLFTRLAGEARRPVVFLFPGLGDHYPQMGRELYEEEPVYREVFDRAAEVLAPEIGHDLRRVVYPGERPAAPAGGPDLAGMLGRRSGADDGVLHRTSISQPALFAAEYALARLWISWGIRPEAVAGYSLGEYVAACLAGVLRFEDALLLVARRARLIEELPAGAMLSVGLERGEVEPLLGGDLDVAAVNGPELTVTAGPPDAVARLEERLGEAGVACRRLPTLHAFHSRAMEPVAARLTELAASFRPRPPQTPVLSNVTGTWLTPGDAADPGYWSRHLLGTVELAKGFATLWSNPNRALLEVGPGLGLATLALQNAPPEAASADLVALPSMPSRFEARDAQAYAVEALAKLWLAGVETDWTAFYGGERRWRVPLPTYPFERRRFWIEPPSGRAESAAAAEAEARPAAAAHDRPGLATAYAEPSTDRERSILAIFEELLGVRGLGVHDSFFELGGHSLMATQVLSRLVETFGVELDLATFFSEPTAAGLARAVSSDGGKPMPELPARRARRPDEAWEAPLSFAQERMWFLHQLQPESPMYNIPLAARLSGRLDVAALCAGLTAVVARHAVLRTTFPAAGGAPRQAIARAATWPLPVADLSRLEPPHAEAETARLVAADARRPFDLASGPVMRTTLLRRSDEDHALVVAMHHIASDGWSMGVFMEDVARFYASLAPAPEPALQYADYAVWQRSWLEGGELARQVDYWREALDGAPAALDLPTDRPRPPIRTPRGGRRHRRLGAALTAASRSFVQRQKATPFIAFLAAWSALLGRWTGAADVVVGTLVANRRHVELERLIGFFVNTLALRVGAGGRPSFHELVARAQRTALGAFDHQDLPFERLVQELAVVRDMSRTPVFQVMLVLQNTPLQAIDTGDLKLEVLPFEVDTSRFDLTLGLDEIEGRLLGYLEYDANLFDPVTVDRMLASFERLLAAAVEEPARAVADLPLFDAAQRHQVLVEWNGAAAERPAARTVHGLFEAWARRAPGAEAVAFEDVRMTYGELDAAADRLAARLLELGVAPEEAVAVALERSEAVPVALLGVLKAGAAYLPIDLAYPEQRLAFMIGDAGAGVVVTRSASRAALPETGAAIVDLDELGEPAAPRPAVPVSPRQLAYLIYTSGSTGRPKGVEVPHSGVVSFLAAMARRPGLGAGETFAAITTISFDISVLELFLPLAVGGRTWIVARDDAADPRRLGERLARATPAAVQATPATWRMLAADGWDNPEGAVLLSGGEALSLDLARRLAASAPALWNLYGPTETTVWSALERFSDDADGAVPIGRPVAGERIHVADRTGRPVPCGVPGELLIGGPGVTRGYRRRPARTAAAFVPDPFAEEPGARLYRTGDLGRFGATGRLAFLGRVDHQVKVRGFRIELGDVEAALARHPDVGQAVVTAPPGAGGTSRLVAYVVPREESEPTLAELRRHLGGILPDYMLPNALVTLEALPLTASGKVDRRRLPEPGGALTEKPFVAPRGALEERLARIWSEVLGLGEVGVEHDFFELGGHSLLATQILSRIQDAFGVRLTLQDLFAGPTVARLAGVIEASAARPPLPETPPLPTARRSAVPGAAWEAPVSFAQERMWFLHQLQPLAPIYNLPLPARLSGPLDVAVLRAALTELVARHEILRTTFPAAGGTPRQAIAPAAPWPLPLVELAGLGAPRAEAEAARLAAADSRRPFDLAAGPVMRTTLLRRSAEDHVLLVSMHHIASDGWSMNVLVEDVAGLYGALAGAPGAEPPVKLPLQYADFAAWQRTWLDGDELARQIGYWRERLAGAPAALDLPADRPRPPVRAAAGGRRYRRFGPELVAGARGLARSEGATLFMTVLAAWSALLGRSAGATDLVVGTLVANRGHLDLERLIGFFVNTLALRVGLGGAPAFRELIARARRTALEAFDHQDLPFERLVRELTVERDLARTPVFQVMLILQNMPPRAVETGDLKIEVLPPEIGTSRFDLTLGLEEVDGRLLGYLEYDAGLFDPVTVDRTLASFERLLAAAVEDPARPIGELPLLGAAQRHQVLAEWNDADAEPPAASTIHGLFEARARRTPEAEAVAFEDVRMTYGELDAAADRLAARLLELGVAPEEAVAVALERSEAVPVALLGVLKAGAAYLPIDLAYPAKRLAFMIDDAAARVVVTRSASRAALPETGAAVVDLDELGELRGAPPAVPVSPRQLAYLIYTSGSTGRPKGVEVHHGGVVSFLASMARRPGLGAGDTFAALTTVAFDISVLELFLPLAVGGRVWIVGRDDAADPRRLAERLAAARPAAVQATPATWRMLAADGWENPDDAVLLSGGEALKVDLARRLAASAPALWNLYGPTETTVWSSIERFSDGAGAAGVAPIGGPIANTRIHVVDRAARPVPCGVPGELLIGGRGVTRGYRRRPALTAAAFVPDPFAAEPGGRLYRTGDLGRFSPYGRLDFLGRIDHQVKVRGFRIELGDVEAALGRHPQVAQAVVTARPGADGAGRLVAYVVPRAESEPTLAGLRRHLGEVLPDYMLPNALETLEELPLTPNGKVDRRRLPEPGAPRTEKPFVAPRGPLEERVAEIWRDVLGVDRIGVEHDFFEIGGHSLLATQILSRVQDAFQVRISLQDLFAAPTVARLAELVEKQQFSEAMDDTERSLLDQVETLSDDEIERELERLGAVNS